MRHRTIHAPHPPHYSPLSSFILSIRVRLTLWYLGTILFILLGVGGSLYGAQTHLNANTVDSQVEAQLYENAQPITDTYKQAILDKLPPASQRVSLATREVVLLLRPDGTILDTRGPLTNTIIQQLQAHADKSQAAFNMVIPQAGTQAQRQGWGWGWGWWATTNDYRILAVPILQKDTRIAILLIGLPRESQFSTYNFWIFHGTILLLISIIGGYWLASKAMRPVRTITRLANEITATDLRRRLNLRRRDEFGELAATFDQMLARLEAAFKRQSQFTADASHELRTPLTIIDLEINRALTQLQTPEEYRQVLEQIQDENEQMGTIVNSLLLLARADTGQIVLHREEVDLSDLALACVERLLPLARQSQITLATGDLPELLILGDPHYLSRMMTNLIENAIKYTSGVGQRVHVELACEQEHWGIVRVQDDGPGIADEHLPYLFDRFYRVDKARTRSQKGTTTSADQPGGTGLGLAIVQWIVQAHNGTLHVESQLQAGSLFEIKFPLRTQNQDDKSMTKKATKIHPNVIRND